MIRFKDCESAVQSIKVINISIIIPKNFLYIETWQKLPIFQKIIFISTCNTRHKYILFRRQETKRR